MDRVVRGRTSEYNSVVTIALHVNYILCSDKCKKDKSSLFQVTVKV